MASQPTEESNGYVYRRVAPPHFKVKRNEVAPDAFKIQSSMRGLSVFRADIASPYQVLQECIEDQRKRLNDPDATKRNKASDWLAKNPDVETLVQKEYRLVKIPIAAIEALGFTEFEGPEQNGHINIIGTAEAFDNQAFAFVELINESTAYILSMKECLVGK